MTATSPNAPSYSKPGNHGSFEPINGGVVYTLGETPPAGQANNYQAGTWQCTNGVQVQNDNQITVPKGTQTECTITNTRKTSDSETEEDRLRWRVGACGLDPEGRRPDRIPVLLQAR